jgi:hypothetical protein
MTWDVELSKRTLYGLSSSKMPFRFHVAEVRLRQAFDRQCRRFGQCV